MRRSPRCCARNGSRAARPRRLFRRSSTPSAQLLYYLMSWHEGENAEGEARARPLHCLARARRDRRRAVARARELAPARHRASRREAGQRACRPLGPLAAADFAVAASDADDRREINNPARRRIWRHSSSEAKAASASSDLYACGVTLYELLTRKYPYGEVEPFQRPRFGEPVPPTRYRPDTPAWLEAVLLKACARDAKERFETAEEFLLALERGAHRRSRSRAVRRSSRAIPACAEARRCGVPADEPDLCSSQPALDRRASPAEPDEDESDLPLLRASAAAC